MRWNQSCRLGVVLSLAASAALLLPRPAATQQQPAPPGPVPRLLGVNPPGGKAGTSFEIVLSGQDIEEAEALHFSVPGVKAEVIDPGAAVSSDPKKPVATAAKFKITIPANTPPGIHDLRLVNKYGISSPRAFVVGNLADILEKEPNNDIAEAQRVDLNTTVNGVISNPTDVDYFLFTGKKGQRVIVSCLTSSIDSRLPAALQFYNSSGSPVAFNRNYQGTDALVDYTLPTDGDYYVRLFAFTYTLGGPEHFYRLTISTAPWIDAVFPPVVEPGKATQVTVYGRNLPGGKLDPTAVVEDRVLEKVVVAVNAPKEPAVLWRLAYSGRVEPLSTGLDGFEYRLKNSVGASNPHLLTYAQAPVVLDNDKNDTPETAQPITLPCEIAGRVDPRRDRDWYGFSAKKGDTFSIEAYGDRLGSPVDLYFIIRNADSGQVVGEFDDNPEILSTTQFYTRTEDPVRQRFVAPADGRYQLMVSSREAYLQASPRHLYRVRITAEKPDFRLVVMPPATNGPDSVVVRQGGSSYYTVFAWRQDGFTGDIALSIDGLPPGVTCPPQVIGTGLRQATLVVTAARDAMPWSGAIKVKGTALIDGQKVEREARAATISWPMQQQNAVTISRLDHEVVLAVREQAPFNLVATVDKDVVLHGDKATVTVKLQRLAADFKAPVQVSVLNLPATVQVQPITIADKGDGTVSFTPANTAPPGTYTLLLRGQAQVSITKNPKLKPTNATVTQVAQPVTITILPRQVATVNVSPAAPTAKPGTEVELVIKVARQGGYTGELKLELVESPETKGLSAASVSIPAGKDEARLLLKVAPTAAPGARKGLIKATALVTPKTPVTQEGKFSVTVAK
jgi:hypothetical protein